MFNLVYVNNVASIRCVIISPSIVYREWRIDVLSRLWERLGFTKAGCIPRAGRLKRADGNGEEYVDAWVFYKSFIEDGSAPEGS